MENGNRAVTITNNINNNIDKIIYDIESSIMYLNGKVFSTFVNNNNALYHSNDITADGWKILSTDSHYISWREAIAGMIAVYLGTLGTAGVIAAMGTTALGIIAANSSGGTLYVELHSYSAPFVTPQYRFVWTFTASTGDSYGPYYYHYSA